MNVKIKFLWFSFANCVISIYFFLNNQYLLFFLSQFFHNAILNIKSGCSVNRHPSVSRTNHQINLIFVVLYSSNSIEAEDNCTYMGKSLRNYCVTYLHFAKQHKINTHISWQKFLYRSKKFWKILHIYL